MERMEKQVRSQKNLFFPEGSPTANKPGQLKGGIIDGLHAVGSTLIQHIDENEFIIVIIIVHPSRHPCQQNPLPEPLHPVV